MIIRNGRDGEIRTRDLTHPKRARYQAAPRPVSLTYYPDKEKLSNTDPINPCLLRAAFVFLLEYREQFAQLRRYLFQPLSLFSRTSRNVVPIIYRRRLYRFNSPVSVRSGIGSGLFVSISLKFSATAQLARQPFLRTSDRVLVFVKQLFNPQRHLDVALAIHALSGAILLRREHRKLRLPVAQHVRLDAREFANFADFEEELFGYGYSGTTHSLNCRNLKIT